MESDTDLALRLRNGDEAALRMLYDRLGGHVFALALAMLGSREDAEEVVQDAFVKLFRSAGRFDPERGSLRAYLYTIARNEARMRLRAGRARPRKLGDVDLHAPDAVQQAPQDGDPLDRVTVQRAFSRLEPDEVKLLHASFFQGYSHGEIADATGTPLGTVKSRIRRALHKLRAYLEEA